MRSPIRRLALFAAVAACGETLPAAQSDGGGTRDAGGDATNGADGGTDATNDASDAGTANLVTNAIVEPWHLAVAGSDLVVTSHAATKGGVFRVSKVGGNMVQIAQRGGYGLAVKGTDDVWFCNADTAPGLVEVSIDGGANDVRLAEVCYDVAVEATGDIAFTQLSKAQRFTVDGGAVVQLYTGTGPEGIAGDDAGVYVADRAGNKIGFFRYGVGPGTLTANATLPTRVRADGTFVYWVESTSNKVQRMRADGIGMPQEVSTGPDITAEGGLAVDDTHVYWVVARGPNAGLYRAPKGGGSNEPIKTGLKFPVDVAVDDDFAYVTVNGENTVLRFAKK